MITSSRKRRLIESPRRNDRVRPGGFSDASFRDDHANVKVDAKPGRTAGKDGRIHPKVKWVSAHDLRRSFGERWAQKVMPQVLQRLMRHSTIETTLRHYVSKDAAVTSRTVWQAVGMELPGSKKPKTTAPTEAAEAVSEPCENSCESDPR